MNKKLIIFDLDGTLVNTVKDLNTAINYSLNKNGYPLVSEAHTSKAIGNGIRITLKRSIPKDVSENVLDKVLSDFRGYYKDHYLDYSLPYEGMVETLKELKSRGYLLAVATNKLESIAKDMIEKLYPNIFDIIVGDDLHCPKKPNPFIINKVLSSLTIQKEDTIYVGDSEVDIESAKNAQVDLLLVDYGFHRSEEYISLSEQHIKYPKQLLNL